MIARVSEPKPHVDPAVLADVAGLDGHTAAGSIEVVLPDVLHVDDRVTGRGCRQVHVDLTRLDPIVVLPW